MSNTITRSQQKLDIDDVRGKIQAHIQDLKQKEEILKRAMKAIDEGEDMWEDNSMLAQEVRKIMREY